MEQKTPAPTLLHRKKPSSEPTVSKDQPSKHKLAIEEAARKKKVDKLISRFANMSENEMRSIFVELTGDQSAFINFLKVLHKRVNNTDKSDELDYPYIKAYKQFKIDQQLRSQKAIEFKRKYYLQFKMIATSRKSTGENEDTIYKELAQFLSKISVEETNDKKKKLYFTGNELRELMELIDELEQLKIS